MVIAEKTTPDAPMIVNRTLVISESYLCFSSSLRDVELMASDQKSFVGVLFWLNCDIYGTG